MTTYHIALDLDQHLELEPRFQAPPYPPDWGFICCKLIDPAGKIDAHGHMTVEQVRAARDALSDCLEAIVAVRGAESQEEG